MIANNICNMFSKYLRFDRLLDKSVESLFSRERIKLLLATSSDEEIIQLAALASHVAGFEVRDGWSPIIYDKDAFALANNLKIEFYRFYDDIFISREFVCSIDCLSFIDERISRKNIPEDYMRLRLELSFFDDECYKMQIISSIIYMAAYIGVIIKERIKDRLPARDYYKIKENYLCAKDISMSRALICKVSDVPDFALKRHTRPLSPSELSEMEFYSLYLKDIEEIFFSAQRYSLVIRNADSWRKGIQNDFKYFEFTKESIQDEISRFNLFFPERLPVPGLKNLGRGTCLFVYSHNTSYKERDVWNDLILSNSHVIKDIEFELWYNKIRNNKYNIINNYEYNQSSSGRYDKEFFYKIWKAACSLKLGKYNECKDH